MEVTHPPALSPGDRIAIVAPSMSIDEKRLDIGLDRLRDVFDLDPVVFDTARRDREWLRDHPGERAEDVLRAFANPEIRGVMVTTGGDDQLRILKHLDTDTLRENPTRFYGYSDNDNLRLFLWNLGIVSYGAQVIPSLAVDPEIHPYTERYLRRAFFEDRLGELEPAEEWTDNWYDFETGDPREWRENDGWEWWCGPEAGETAAGRIWGGCYEIVDWHLETSRYLPDPADLDSAVLALEPSEELPRATDIGYTLRSMGERGLLERFSGVLVGRPRSGTPGYRDIDGEVYRENIREAVCTQLREYNSGAIAVFNLDFGHTDPHIPLPVGGRVELDSKRSRIVFR